MSDLEEELRALDAELEKMQKRAGDVADAVKRARSAVNTGRVAEIPKALAQIGQRASGAAAEAEGLSARWQFDAAAYLSDGRFLRDLEAEAAKEGLSIFERDGRIYCFPLLLRIEPKELGVKIGRKLERRISPGALVRSLARAQKAPQRFREQRFLDLLYQTWKRLAGSARDASGPGEVALLSDIYDTLTLFPGTDYPIEEFARDLLLLDRAPHLVTKDGSRFELLAATLSKGKAKQITAYDERGREHVYIGLRFVRQG